MMATPLAVTFCTRPTNARKRNGPPVSVPPGVRPCWRLCLFVLHRRRQSRKHALFVVLVAE